MVLPFTKLLTKKFQSISELFSENHYLDYKENFSVNFPENSSNKKKLV